MFLSDKEVAQEAQATAYNERIGDDLVSAFINENRDTKGFKATVDGKEVKFRKDDGSLIQDIKFSCTKQLKRHYLMTKVYDSTHVLTK